MNEFWDELDHAVLGCLEGRASVSPDDIARRLRLSEEAVVSLLAMLACEGKVRIRIVDGVEQRALAA